MKCNIYYCYKYPLFLFFLNEEWWLYYRGVWCSEDFAGTKLKIYVYVPSSGAGLTYWASKLIAPMQNISNISTSKLDGILKISESAVAIFLCLQSTFRVIRLPEESFMHYYSRPFIMWGLSYLVWYAFSQARHHY